MARRALDPALRGRRAGSGQGIARNTAQIPALDATIATATEVLAAAGAVAGKLDTVATVLEQRAA